MFRDFKNVDKYVEGRNPRVMAHSRGRHARDLIKARLPSLRTHNDEFFDFENTVEGLYIRQISIRVEQFAVSVLHSELLQYIDCYFSNLTTSFAALDCYNSVERDQMLYISASCDTICLIIDYSRMFNIRWSAINVLLTTKCHFVLNLELGSCSV